MLKKVIIGGLLAILIGAVAIGAFDYLHSESALAYQGENTSDGQAADIGQEQGYRGSANEKSTGGRGAGQPDAMNTDDKALGDRQPQAMVAEWITVQGAITAVELNALTIETPAGETILVQLGPEHYWIEQGVVFEAGDQVEIIGFYKDEVSFSAGTVTRLETGEMLALRDADGRPLWAGGPGRGNNGNRLANGNASSPDWTGDPVSAADLDDVETEGLVFMREEEKLARDVYLTLYDLWGMGIFNNIAGSEQTHMDALLTLLDRYGLEDPAAGLGIGEFINPDLQALYNQLMAQGSQSLVEALRVGAAIEEIDILDLQEYIDQTDQADIQQVYQRLLQGSENHLRAFVSVLEQQGESYQPQFISSEAYQVIINTAAGPSGNSGRGGRGQ